MIWSEGKGGSRGDGGAIARFVLDRRRKVWSLTGYLHNFALFQRILLAQSSSRPTQAGIGWESAYVDVEQPAFVIHCKGIPTDNIVIVGRCRIDDSVLPLRECNRTNPRYQHPVWRGKAWNGQSIDIVATSVG